MAASRQHILLSPGDFHAAFISAMAEHSRRARLAWVRQGLVPALQKDDLVIMDNLATHKIAGVGQAIQTVGARLLYLLPYSPDFNPIENMWSKIKQILRSAAPRTRDQLIEAARTAFNAISTADCRGFFLHARYAI